MRRTCDRRKSSERSLMTRMMEWLRCQDMNPQNGNHKGTEGDVFSEALPPDYVIVLCELNGHSLLGYEDILFPPFGSEHFLVGRLCRATMSTGSAKLSFSLASSNGFTSSPAPTNLELLMAKAKPAKPAKPAAPLFDDDDDPTSHRPPPSLLAGPSKTIPTAQPRQSSTISRAERRAHEYALRVDSSVFDYDGVYDGMKAAEQRLEAGKKVETEERKPKYIGNFLASAQTRRLDRLRAEEKMLQLEREKEGDEFADKDRFVTDAYKKQMEEVRAAEEEERKRDGTSRL